MFPIMPQQGQAQGPWGGQIYGPPQNQLPYQTNPASNWIQGIGMFLQNFRAEKEAEKERNRQMFQKGMEQMMMGIPVDKRKLLTYAKKGGMDLDMEGPTPEEVEFQKKKQQQEQAQALLMSGRGPMFAPQQVVDQASQAPTPPPPRQQPGIMSRIGNAMGFGGGLPPGVENSKAMQGLAQLEQMVQMKRQSEMAKMQMEKADVDIALQALRGDPKAVDHMRSTGKWAKYSDLEMLIKHLPEEEQALAKKQYLNHVVGETEMERIRSNYNIQMAKMEYDKKLDVLKNKQELMKQFSYAPPELAHLAAFYLTTDPTGPIAQEALKELQKFKGPSESEKWSTEKGFKERELGLRERGVAAQEGQLRLGEKRLAFDWNRASVQDKQDRDKQNLAIFNSFNNVQKDRVQQRLNLHHQLKANGQDDEALEVMKSLVHELNQFGDVKVNIGGREISMPTSDLTVEDVGSLFGLMSDEQLKVKKPDGSLLDKMKKEAGGPSPEAAPYLSPSMFLPPPPIPQSQGTFLTDEEINRRMQNEKRTREDILKEAVNQGRIYIPGRKL